MHGNTWDRLGAIFDHAIGLPPEARAAYIAAAAGDDDRLRTEALAMVAAHEGDALAAAPQDLLASSRGGGVTVGSVLGPYRITGVIGRGGMGEVFVAVRSDDQFEQQVAIKVVRPERATPELTRRFLQERQILATLTHPSIATLLDGGIGPGGQPYLVMQYVDGTPITRYAVERGLDLRQRLELFVAVCQAVQFAHRHLVVHRDLKPSNILVDGEGIPRLLDFGIAKLLDPSAAASTTGDLLLLTPEHAAPEQFLGQPVTTATDVYALGVLLYELLTGTRPFQDVPAPELPRAVCERPPAPPSTHRPVDPDLDQIVLMALRKEPGRRYASAGQLAEDVTRFLGGWPVAARPDTAGYRVRRFVARNWAAVGGAAVALVALIGATGWSAWQSAQRAAALEVAVAERGRATRITTFLLNIFRATNPNETRGRTVTARELLDQAAARVPTDLASDPAARADMQLAIGQAYLLVGLTSAADSVLAEVVEARRGLGSAAPLDLAMALEWRGRAQLTAARLDEGIATMEQVVAIRERELGSDAVDLVPALQRIALAQHQRGGGVAATDSALVLLARVAGILERADSGRTAAAAEVERFRAWLTQDAGRDAEALEIQRRAVAIATAAAPDADDPNLFRFKETLALMLTANGHRDSAIAIHRELLAARRRVFGPASDDVSFSLFNLASMLREAGQAAEAEPLIRECIAIRERLLGPEHLQTGYAIGVLAGITADLGNRAAGIDLYRRSIAIIEKVSGPANLSVVNRYESIALIQLAMGQRNEA
ncbi:MAG: serine/threonine protein kinase, partial [Gemmatimonadetes bacterium]|nr:serine/threonine protein kinase [Gemmatimonadota bacterium]